MYNPYFSPMRIQPAATKFIYVVYPDGILSPKGKSIEVYTNGMTVQMLLDSIHTQDLRCEMASVNNLPFKRLVINNIVGDTELMVGDVITKIDNRTDADEIIGIINQHPSNVKINIERESKEIEVNMAEVQIDVNVHEKVFMINLKHRIHKKVIISHGVTTPNIKTVPPNVKLIFYCKNKEILAASDINLPMVEQKICNNQLQKAEIAPIHYNDIFLRQYQNYRLQLADCTTKEREDIRNGIFLSEIIHGLHVNLNYELHIFACRAEDLSSDRREVDVKQ